MALSVVWELAAIQALRTQRMAISRRQLVKALLEWASKVSERTMSKYADVHPVYHSVTILGSKCFVDDHDIRSFYGLVSKVSGSRIKFDEIPEDAYIVRVVWERKKAAARRMQPKEVRT